MSDVPKKWYATTIAAATAITIVAAAMMFTVPRTAHAVTSFDLYADACREYTAAVDAGDAPTFMALKVKMLAAVDLGRRNIEGLAADIERDLVELRRAATDRPIGDIYITNALFGLLERRASAVVALNNIRAAKIWLVMTGRCVYGDGNDNSANKRGASND